jgi:hypothetical protein
VQDTAGGHRALGVSRSIAGAIRTFTDLTLELTAPTEDEPVPQGCTEHAAGGPLLRLGNRTSPQSRPSFSGHPVAASRAGSAGLAVGEARHFLESARCDDCVPYAAEVLILVLGLRRAAWLT